MKNFSAIVDATYSGILKPDPRAYAQVVDELDISAANCVFVDDQRRNVDGAIQFGMQAVEFDVTQPYNSWVKALGLSGIPEEAMTAWATEQHLG